ncbi:CAP domain-containing protein [Sphingomonas sp.]|uniref:CAP domain-containing protein n=2 Tax=Sphingomonas sp. TaxID=28214 RepID=UPI0035A92417
MTSSLGTSFMGTRALGQFGSMIAIATLLIGCATQGPARVVERVAGPPAAQPRSATLLRADMLAGHNRARAAIGVPPLAWDDSLSADADAYAQILARTGDFRHADQPRDRPRQGENLFTGTRGAYSYAEMVDLWVAEKKDFINRPTPNFSLTGKWGDVGHYAQIIWRSTTAVGCALASNARDDYLVCRYSPAGNVWAQPAY